MKYICALLVVEDMAKARRFYEQILDQKVAFDFGQNLSFEGGLAIHLRSHYQELLGLQAGPIVANSNSFEVYFEEDDLPLVEQKLKDANAPFVHGIVEQPWGQRVLRVRDPDGHIVEVGETMTAVVRRLHDGGAAMDAISARTGLPESFIRQALEGS